MKKTKVITTLCALAVVLLLGIFTLPTEAQATKEGYYTYTVSNGEATITDCVGSISGDITIPSTVHTIEHSVFTNSVAHSITCLATVPPVLGQWAFSASSYPYTPIGCPIYVPAASYDSYLADTAWSAYKDYIQKM